MILISLRPITILFQLHRRPRSKCSINVAAPGEVVVDEVMMLMLKILLGGWWVHSFVVWGAVSAGGEGCSGYFGGDTNRPYL